MRVARAREIRQRRLFNRSIVVVVVVVVGRRPVVMSTATRFFSLCRRVANRNSKRQSVREYSSRYETDMLDIKTQMASKKKTKHARPNRKKTCGAGWRNIRSSKYQTISNQNSKSFRIARARTHVVSRPEQQRRTFIFSLLASLVLSTSLREKQQLLC